MKYLLFILAFLPFFAKSQSQDTVKIPMVAAKQIVKDLLSGDSSKAELKLSTETINLLNQKILFKDSIISSHIQKGIMYEERIKNEQDKFFTQGIWVKSLERQNKKLKSKLTFGKITFVAVLAGFSYLYIKK